MGNKARQVQKFYDGEANRYFGERYAAETCESYAYNSRKALVSEMLEGLQGSILDVGCGPAIYTNNLLDRGLTVTAVDLSPEMLAKAQELTGKRVSEVTWANCELEHLIFSNGAFDTVMAIGVIAYAEDTSVALRELNRVIKTGGNLILQSTNAVCPTKFIYRLKDTIMFTLGIRKKGYSFGLISQRYGRMRDLLERNGFKVLEKKSYDFRIPFLDRISHGGTGAVKAMKFLHRLCSASPLLGWLGEGYIIKAVKLSDTTCHHE